MNVASETRNRKPASSALARFRVIDLTRVRAGPTAARQLADWGADVIAVEMPAQLAEGDALGGPRNGSDFRNLHRNNRSITLNLKSEEGRAILMQLVESADVVIENFRPDVKHRLGIDYEALSARNPRLVYASISGFGQSGPYRDRPGFDQIAQGMGGLMSITGHPDQGPIRAGIPIADLAAGIFCAYGILVALIEREASGKGQWLHTSLLQAMTFMLDFQAARWLMDGEVPAQEGNNHPTAVPTGAFPTRDGFINIAVVGQRIWERFCQAIDRTPWIDAPEYANNESRRLNRSSLDAEIAAVLRTDDSANWIERLNRAGVPCGPIYAMDQVFADPQVRHLGMAAAIADADGSSIEYLAQPIVLERTPSRIVRPTPEIGEDTTEVLTELGIGAEELEELRSNNVI